MPEKREHMPCTLKYVRANYVRKETFEIMLRHHVVSQEMLQSTVRLFSYMLLAASMASALMGMALGWLMATR